MFGLRLQYWEDDVVEGTMLQRSAQSRGGGPSTASGYQGEGEGESRHVCGYPAMEGGILYTDGYSEVECAGIPGWWMKLSETWVHTNHARGIHVTGIHVTGIHV